MIECCTVCGEWFPRGGTSRLDICEPCYTANFAGASPPLDLHAPMAREMLEAYVDSSHQLSPRQAEALTRIAAVWRRQAGEGEA